MQFSAPIEFLFYCMNEVWKPVEGYEWIYKEFYEVSNLGRIKSLPRLWSGWHEWIIRKIKVNKNWYTQICLSYKCLDKYPYVHRLVAQAFIENSDLLKTDINHKNWIKTDNRVENLEWCTKSENQQHRQYVLMKKSNVSLLQKNNELMKRKIIQYDLNWNLICKFNSIKEWVKATWISTIWHCLYWYQKTAGWFIFKYNIYEN
jgi:hypothetical protein